MKYPLTAYVGVWDKCVSVVPEPYCVFEKVCEGFTEALPLREAVVLVDFERAP